MYASETIQNCKNPTGHIDTLNGVASLQEKQYLAKQQTGKVLLENNQYFYSIADFLFVLNQSLSEHKQANKMFSVSFALVNRK